MPSDTNKIIYGIEISGITHYYDRYNLGSSTNQYYYFDKNYVDVLYCTGKRENGIETTKDIITNNKKVHVVQITTKEKVTQNTGLNLSENQLFDIATSPFVFQIDGTNVKNYILTDTSFEGLNTRTFGNRNTVLNLISEKSTKRFTNTENNFYR